MKIVVIANKTNNLARARKKLLQEFIKKDYEVVCICPEKEYIEELQKIGVKTIKIQWNRISSGLFSNILYFKQLVKILKEEKPDIVFSYTAKPNIVGSISAKIAKVPRIYCMLTGLGYIYSTNKFKIKVIRFFCNRIYKIALKCCTKVIFQNKDDRDFFIKKKFVDEEKAYVVDGSGVDLEKFQFTKLPNEFNFLMISRLLDVKGVEEFCKAAEIVKSKFPNITFTLLGEIENSYRDVKIENIKKYQENNIINYEGYKEDVLPYLKNCMVFVLPSYLKEGIPRSVLEAMAIGRPIITTNVSGCKETVKEGINGYLVEPKNYIDLANKMEFMIENKDLLENMGKHSFEYVKERFDVNLINKKMLEIMDLF